MYDTSLETCNTQSHEKYPRHDNHEVWVFLSVAETIDLWCGYCSVTFQSLVLRQLVIASICNIIKLPEVRACLHGGGGPLVGGVTRLSI